MEKITKVFTLHEGKISFKDDRTHISGKIDEAERQPLADSLLMLDDLSEVTDSHFRRVIFGQKDVEKETDFISISTGYDLMVGVPDESGQIKQLANTEDVDLYRGDIKVKVLFKIITHTEKGKKYKYIVGYPIVAAIPADWTEHLFDPFEGF